MSGGPRGLISNRSRRKFLQAITAGAAMIPFVMSRNAVADEGRGGNDGDCDADDDYKGPGCHCLLRGTKILTDRGPTPIQDLKLGDLVVTESGRLEPVKWIAKATIAKPDAGDWHEEVLPIRIAQSAIDENLPSRDLYLSPGHCLFIDGYLIPADYLVNGTSIVQAAPSGLDVLDYFHVEFERHEVVYAEGVPVESMHLPDGRPAPADLLEYERLYGSQPQSPMAPYAPILGYRGIHGNALALARAALSRWIDIRDPIQVVYDRLEARATVFQLDPRKAELASA